MATSTPEVKSYVMSEDVSVNEFLNGHFNNQYHDEDKRI